MTVHKGRPCHPSNYRAGRTLPVEFLVLHYVGAVGSAFNNAAYYGSTANIGASAHYFVGHADEGAAVWQSVAEGDTAWHCGTTGAYRHPKCRNANSIGVELCCHKGEDGRWYFDGETVDAAVELCRDIAARYGLDRDHMVRHYDVTGKVCPAPFVLDERAWEDFKDRVFSGQAETSPSQPPRNGESREDNGRAAVRLYTRLEDMPLWALPAAKRAVENGYIKQDSAGAVGVWETNLQSLVWMDRAGLLDRPAVR